MDYLFLADFGPVGVTLTLDLCCSAVIRQISARKGASFFTRQMNPKPPATYAAVFHSVTGSFLAAQGFALTGDPESIGVYGGSAACYRSGRGLSLWVMFEPFDGAAAWVSCGREWTPKAGATFLSNSYSSLARRFGLDLPLGYPIAKGEQPIIVAHKVLVDLKSTLPIVVSKVSIKDLLAIENEEPSGAALSAMKMNFGEDHPRAVHISDFSES